MITSFTDFIAENELSLPFEFSYNGNNDHSIILGVSAVNNETPSIKDLTNFLEEVSNGNYDVVMDKDRLAVCCDKATAKNIITTQADLLRKTTVLRSDEDLTDLIDDLRYNEMMISEINNSI